MQLYVKTYKKQANTLIFCKKNIMKRGELLVINVMIADDDYNARTGLADMIDWDSLDAKVVAVAEDGEQAVNLLRTTPDVDLIILDICMPYQDGLSVAKFIRDNEYETEIILLSAHAEFEYAREALKYDIREYIIKPINRAKLDQLTDVIKSVSMRKSDAINWRRLLHGKELQQSIRSACRSGDEDEFGKLLDIEDIFSNVSIRRHKEYYLVMLSLMREFCQGTDVDSMDEKCIERFHELADIHSMKQYMTDMFNNIIYKDRHDSSKQSSGNIVLNVKKFIEDNISSPDIHSSAVADHFNLSVDHISRLFKGAGDTSLSDYIINTKIDKAKELIENTDHSIRQIAQMLGYSDPNYFVRVFKKRTGVTPTEYRTKAKETPG